MVQKGKSEGRRDSKRRGGHFESSADETGSGSRSCTEPKLFKKHKAVFSHVPLFIEEPSKMKYHSKRRRLRSESSKKSYKLTCKDALDENRKFMKSILDELKVGGEKMLLGLREEIRKVGGSDNQDDNVVVQNPESFACARQDSQDQDVTKKTTLGSEEPSNMNLDFTFERVAGLETESCEKRDEPSCGNSFNLCDALKENRKFMKSILEDLRVGGEKMLIRLKEDVRKVRESEIDEEEGVTADGIQIPVEGQRNVICDEGAEKGRLAISVCDPSMDACGHHEGFLRDIKEEFEDYSDRTEDAKRTKPGFHCL